MIYLAVSLGKANLSFLLLLVLILKKLRKAIKIFQLVLMLTAIALNFPVWAIFVTYIRNI